VLPNILNLGEKARKIHNPQLIDDLGKTE